MHATINTDRVARAFHRNHATYDQHAIVQREMARALIAPLRDLCPHRLGQVLELGCGTGLVTRELAEAFDLGACTVNDLVPDLAESAADLLRRGGAGPVACLPGDIEAITEFPAAQSLIVSGATFQWLRDIARFLLRITAHLRPGGLLAFSTFGPENLRELRNATGIGLPYPPLDSLRAILAGSKEVLVAREWRTTLRFDSALDVLRHLRKTGVNGLAECRWTPRQLNRFCAEFERSHPFDGGVALTYHPIVIIARKPGQVV